MSVTGVEKDFDGLTMTLTAEFDASRESVWELFADPRKLERWWGPPTHPATVEEHDLTPGARVTYFMTAPDGQVFRGLWEIVAADPPSSLEFADRFANDDGSPNDEMPSSTAAVTLTESDGKTRMQIRSSFESREGMERQIEMGAEEGLKQAVSQMDGLLAR